MQNTNLEPLGKQGEDLVAREYERMGYKIIGRNVRMHQSRQVGEIDIVAIGSGMLPKNREQQNTMVIKELVFIEVKTRRSKRFGSPADAVNLYKQRKLVRAAELFLLRHPQYDQFDWRFDVVEVDIDNPGERVKILMNSIDDLY